MAQETALSKAMDGKELSDKQTKGAICDLRTVIVGGPVAQGFGEPLFTAIQHELDQRSRLMFAQGFQVLPSGLGESGPLVGAAALARSLG